MSTNWKTPSGDDVIKIISAVVMRKSDANTDAADGALEPNPGPFNPDSERTRAKDLVALAVQKVRSAIQSLSRQPLSLTEGSVPPEAEDHVISWAAWRLVISSPSLQQWAMVTEKGVFAPLGDAYKRAEKFFDDTRKGSTVVTPTDPTGQDYLTAVSADNLAIRGGVRWGDQNQTDLDNANGYIVRNGVQITLPVDDMTCN